MLALSRTITSTLWDSIAIPFFLWLYATCIPKQLKTLIAFADLGKLSSGILHDLRSPITALSLAAQAPQPVSTPIIEAATTQIAQLLSVTHIGNTRDPVSVVSIHELLTTARNILAHKAITAQVTVAYHSNTTTHIKTRKYALLHVLLNLISNGIDAYQNCSNTPRTVSIRTEIEQSMVRIIVQDYGCGIPKTMQRKIFTPFYTTKEDGTGIGLAFAYQLVRRSLDGKITILSNATCGTSFIITLPQ